MQGDLSERGKPRASIGSLRSHLNRARCRSHLCVGDARFARSWHDSARCQGSLADARSPPLTTCSVSRAGVSVKPLRGRVGHLRWPRTRAGLPLKTRRFLQYDNPRFTPKRKCVRCSRSLARCGDDHYQGVIDVDRSAIVFERICCFCCVDLEALGASGIVLATDQPSRCPVRTRR